MRILSACVALGVVSLFAACGGASSPLLDDGDAGSGGGDGGSKRDGATDDGDCVSPTICAICLPTDAVCNQVGNGNPCCDQAWRCIDGAWQSEAAECACEPEPQTCGTKTCSTGQYCQVQPPGIALPDGGTPPTGYDCMDPPPSCGGSPSCACLEAAPPCAIDSCNDTSGEVGTIVTLSCIGE